MTLTILEIFVILFIHWVADFVLQSHWQAKNKSHNNYALTMHVTVYSICWLLPMTIMFACAGNYRLDSFLLACFFSLITFATHWVIDFYTSRLNSWLWKKEDVHNFFVSVGFDQFLHFVQLILTYYFLKTL